MGKNQPVSEKRYKNVCKQNEEVRKMYNELADRACTLEKKGRLADFLIKKQLILFSMVASISFVLGAGFF